MFTIIATWVIAACVVVAALVRHVKRRNAIVWFFCSVCATIGIFLFWASVIPEIRESSGSPFRYLLLLTTDAIEAFGAMPRSLALDQSASVVRLGATFLSQWLLATALLSWLPPGRRPCIHCAELVRPAAKVCPHCHRDLPAAV